ncbi:MAG: CPBP family intramembrane glutamic endopeptidase [Candidatus Kariarchaeaceae archaeon]
MKAVFKAEYYTTTSKFRDTRKYIPFIFLGGVFLLSYLLRIVYQFFRGDQVISNPPIPTFFSIIAIFSYFTLFAPLLSPLGRVVYDGGGKSRREVALNSPVQSKDLLYGNLLSNLAFFLPFFGFVGTLTLAPFIGNGIFDPLPTSIALFSILSLLIIVGLVAGTMLSPIIFGFISTRRKSYTRAMVSFSVSAMLVFSLPILRYFLENTTLDGSLGWITFMPFTLASVLIIYILYGVQIALSPVLALVLLFGYIILILLLGYFTADNVYGIDYDTQELASSNPDGLSERLLNKIVSPFGLSYRKVIVSTMKASLRDIEHLSRLTIGLSITIFMIFALSSRGLFREVANFDERVELAVVIFALILSSTSVIFIEASSFTVQHRDMLSLIKSAPNGARKFIIGKAIQMNLLLVPVFVTIVISLTIIGFISASNTLLLILIVILVMVSMTSLSLAIYMVNPSDNEEDLGNFVNLLIFYFLSFFIGTIPVAIVIGEFQIRAWMYIVAILLILSLSASQLYVASEALEKMNLETLDSELSRRIIHHFKVIVLFLITWNILPLFSISYLVVSGSAVGFIVLTYLIILAPVLIYSLQNRTGWKIPFNRSTIKVTISFILGMIAVGSVLQFMQYVLNPMISVLSPLTLLPIDPVAVIFIITGVVVVEELYFRGMLLNYSLEELTKRQAIGITSILFALVHITSVFGFVNALLQSVLLANLRIKTGSVFYSIAAHLIYNFLFLAILLY